ncbi:hypothetical protein D1872_277960 [compost metagenome]
MHIFVGEAHSDIDDDRRVVGLHHHKVTADFTQTAQWCDFHGGVGRGHVVVSGQCFVTYLFIGFYRIFDLDFPVLVSQFCGELRWTFSLTRSVLSSSLTLLLRTLLIFGTLGAVGILLAGFSISVLVVASIGVGISIALVFPVFVLVVLIVLVVFFHSIQSYYFKFLNNR